jgi:hypothetical protein
MNMHFRATDTFTFLFVFLSILSIASPLQVSPRTNVTVDVRQAPDIALGEQSSLIHRTNALT